ncbi:MAG: bifunctional demethylmenaquinone methyltransferase/2-methoxy-6-polyprenyl-1,4-benzoquinol methylase UbiE [Rhodothermaceae bacterium]
MSKKAQVRNMFDAISKKYDFLNHFLSAGIDFYWRKKALKLTGVNEKTKLLDLACGTGDFSLTAKKYGVKSITGADLSKNMLSVFSQKDKDINGKLVQTEAEILPFKEASFTNITVAFGVRNFYDIPAAFKSFYEILEKKGVVTILEFSLPKNFIIKGIYMFYFSKLLPLLGKLISKDKSAYTYLPESVKEFEEKINLPDLLLEAGFSNTKLHKLTFGIVQIVIAEK